MQLCIVQGGRDHGGSARLLCMSSCFHSLKICWSRWFLWCSPVVNLFRIVLNLDSRRLLILFLSYFCVWTFSELNRTFRTNADWFWTCRPVIFFFEVNLGFWQNNTGLRLVRTATSIHCGLWWESWSAQRGSLRPHLRCLQKLGLLLDQLEFLRHSSFFLKRILNDTWSLLWFKQSVNRGAKFFDEGDLICCVHFVLSQLEVRLLVCLFYLTFSLFLSLCFVVLTAQMRCANDGVKVLEVSPDLHVLMRKFLYLLIAVLNLLLLRQNDLLLLPFDDLKLLLQLNFCFSQLNFQLFDLLILRCFHVGILPL